MKRAPHTRAAGFSLIELLVAMAIGLIVTLAITSVLIRTEGSKRSSTSVNDINQSGAYAAFVLDRVIRSAGSGYSQNWNDVYGCLLDVSKGGTAVLPLPAAIPSTSAFTNVSLPMRLAPLIIGKGLADAGTQTRGDVLIVMSGSAGVSESPQTVQPGSVTSNNLRLTNTMGYRTNDMVLLADSGVPGGCMMQEAVFTAAPTGAIFAPGAPNPGGSSDQNLPLGGTYYRANGTNVNVTNFGASTIALQFGNEANLPTMQLYGVGANNTLVSYDLLQVTPPDASIADGVVEMRAVYGLDTNSDGRLDTWADATGAYAASALTDGSSAARTKLRQIIAVRLGLILRTALQERSPSSSASGVLSPETFAQAANTTLTLFGDLPTGLQQTRTLTTAELAYRFRTVEVTIPLRNVLLAP